MRKLVRLCLTVTFLLLTTVAFSQISGIVTDAETGDPLPGASIVLKSNSAVGGVTSLNGKFEIDAQVGSMLVVNFVGYQSAEIIAGDDMSIKLLSAVGS